MSEYAKPHWREVLFTGCGWVVTFVQMASLIAVVGSVLGGFWVYHNWSPPKKIEQMR